MARITDPGPDPGQTRFAGPGPEEIQSTGPEPGRVPGKRDLPAGPGPAEMRQPESTGPGAGFGLDWIGIIGFADEMILNRLG